LICPAQRVIILPFIGLYSDFTSADKTHETEIIEADTMITITLLLVSSATHFRFDRYPKTSKQKLFPDQKKNFGFQFFTFPMSIKNTYSHSTNI